MARDDFNEAVKRNLALRVGHVCSKPDCRASTSGPHEDPAKSVNLGVAAHITAAAPGGPRFDSKLTVEQRSSAENGIWLCQTDGKLVDSDEGRFSEGLLREWKATAEREAGARAGKALAPKPDESNPNAASSSLAAHQAARLNEFLIDQPCEVHQMVAGAVVTGHGHDADAFVECCCPDFAQEIREALRQAGLRLVVRPTLLKLTSPDSAASPRFHLEDIRRGATISWDETIGAVTVRETTWYGTSLLFFAYEDTSGKRSDRFLDRASEKSIVVLSPGNFVHVIRRRPGEPPALFGDTNVLMGLLTRLRDEHLLKALVEAYANEIAARLRQTEDVKATPHRPPVVWQLLSSLPEIETGLRELERNTDMNAIKVAIVLDENVDRDVFNAFTRRIQGSSVKTWFQISELMLASRFSITLAKIQRLVDVLVGAPSPDQLELVEFGLVPNHPTWNEFPEIPYAFTGGPDQITGELVDPVFYLDVRNVGHLEARVDRVYATIRHRQIAPHGFAEGSRLLPVVTIDVPIHNGEEGCHEVKLDAPILISAGRHVRVQVRLEDAGWCWRGVIGIGLRYGPGKVLQVPDLTVLL
jgi:hypothetical protein